MELVQRSTFRLGHVKRIRALDHINAFELRSFGEAERLATGDHAYASPHRSLVPKEC